MDIAEFTAPTEVWKAIEGDRAELIALLRSDKPLRRWTRDELADWLEGKLKPVKAPRGRPAEKLYAYRESMRRRFGHDIYTPLGLAGYRYDRLRKFIKKKGWHLKAAGRRYWSTERLMAEVARRACVNVITFGDYLKRGKRRPARPPQEWDGKRWILESRVEIARQIRRK